VAKEKKRSGVRATAKAEGVAKFAYTRTNKKVTTEVIPPDVTRAKTDRWLDLLSPITEWAGLKGDALRYRRKQLRIQEAETLFRLATEVRKKMAGLEVLQPVSHKILVPALEKVSLENPSDDVMIERWANLLASAAQKLPVQPRFVSILGELAGSQAKRLEQIAFNKYENYSYPYKEFSNSHSKFDRHFAMKDLNKLVHAKLESAADIDAITESVILLFSRPGVFLKMLFCDLTLYDHFQEREAPDEDDFSVLESLGLIRREMLELSLDLREQASWPVMVQLIYYHLTELGVVFCKVCSRPRVLELQRIDGRNLAK
jgi:hypothetical protein